MNVTEEKINWNEFAEKSGEDRLKIEAGKKYLLGFNSVKQDHIEVEDKEKTAEGTIPIRKTIPCLILGVDYIDEKKVTKELSVTSKRLAGDIKTYFEKGLLFSRFFELVKEGEGFQTKYRLLALNDKPKVGVPTPTPA